MQRSQVTFNEGPVKVQNPFIISISNVSVHCTQVYTYMSKDNKFRKLAVKKKVPYIRTKITAMCSNNTDDTIIIYDKKKGTYFHKR